MSRSGTPVMVSGSAERWFGPGFLERSPEAGSALLHALQEADDEGYVQVCSALATFDVRDRLAEIDAHRPRRGRLARRGHAPGEPRARSPTGSATGGA